MYLSLFNTMCDNYKTQKQYNKKEYYYSVCTYHILRIRVEQYVVLVIYNTLHLHAHFFCDCTSSLPCMVYSGKAQLRTLAFLCGSGPHQNVYDHTVMFNIHVYMCKHIPVMHVPFLRKQNIRKIKNTKKRKVKV